MLTLLDNLRIDALRKTDDLIFRRITPLAWGLALNRSIRVAACAMVVANSRGGVISREDRARLDRLVCMASSHLQELAAFSADGRPPPGLQPAVSKIFDGLEERLGSVPEGRP
jgi:hypothetical protein